MGAVHNKFKFKDMENQENHTMLKLRIFKTMSRAADHNGSLRWTISGEGYISKEMICTENIMVMKSLMQNQTTTHMESCS